jgi:hypothetical protein
MAKRKRTGKFSQTVEQREREADGEKDVEGYKKNKKFLTENYM